MSDPANTRSDHETGVCPCVNCCFNYLKERKKIRDTICNPCEDALKGNFFYDFLFPKDEFGDGTKNFVFYKYFYQFLRPAIYGTFLVVSVIALLTSVPHVGRQLVALVVALMLLLAVVLFRFPWNSENKSISTESNCYESTKHAVFYTLVVIYLIACHFAICVKWMPKQSDYLMFSYLAGYVWYILLVKLCFLELLRKFEVWAVEQRIFNPENVNYALVLFLIYLVMFSLSFPIPGMNLFPFVSVDESTINDDDFTGYDDGISPLAHVQTSVNTSYTFSALTNFLEYALPVILLTAALAYFSCTGLKECTKGNIACRREGPPPLLVGVEMPQYEAISRV